MKKALVMIGCSFVGAVLANIAFGIVGSKILMKIGKELTKDGPIEVKVNEGGPEVETADIETADIETAE